jgi:hypothetical protein
MLRRGVASAVLLSMLGGCVSQVQLANSKGETAQCNAAGLGLVTAAVAASGQKDCIERYQSQGYHQVPMPASAAGTTTASADTAKPGVPAKPQANQCNTYGFGLVSSFIAASMQQTCQQQAGQTQK